MLENGNSNTGMYMPVAPAYMGGYGNGGFGGFGGDWGWIILLLLCANGGWGFGGGFGGFGGGLGIDFPWLMNGQQMISNNTNNGFRDAQLSDGINGIRANLGDISTQLCGGFAGVNATINGAQNALAQQLYVNQISDLERSYAAQTATAQGFNGVQSGLCDIRYGNATNTRDIIEAQTRGTQAVLDKLCALELDGYKRDNDNLRSELLYARGQASQTEQTARILAGQASEIDGVYNRLKNCPVGTYNVCNPLTPSGSCGCGGFVA